MPPRPAATEDPLSKQLKVKTGVVVRNLKDLSFARAEVDREKARLASFEATDPDKVKQQRKVIEEALMMIPEHISRIRKGSGELEQFLAENDAELNARTDAGEAVQVARQACADAAKELQ